eukprot:gene14321-47_t
MDLSIAQQIADARDLAACGQPTSALVYFEALIPQLSRYITSISDPYKAGQCSSVLKTLQEEHRLLQDIEAALSEIKNGTSTSGKASLQEQDPGPAPDQELR